MYHIRTAWKGGAAVLRHSDHEAGFGRPGAGGAFRCVYNHLQVGKFLPDTHGLEVVPFNFQQLQFFQCIAGFIELGGSGDPL